MFYSWKTVYLKFENFLNCTFLPGVKINGQYYRDGLLMEDLLPEIQEFSELYIFQEDGAPAHRAREMVALLTNETPDFINPTLWPPNSPDLNPVDYKILGCMQEMVYKTKVRDVVSESCKLVTFLTNELLTRRCVNGASDFAYA